MKQYINFDFKDLIWDTKIPIMVSLSYEERNDKSTNNLFVKYIIII